MGLKKQFCLIAILLVSSALCFAKQISFQIVQHDESVTDVTEQSYTIEDEILNSFFEYGFIVTNSEAQVSTSSAQDEKLYQKGVGEAFEGFSDYFIQINLFFERTEETITPASDLKKVSYSVTNAKTGKKIDAKSVENIKLEHKKDDLHKVSVNLVSEINKTLKRNKA